MQGIEDDILEENENDAEEIGGGEVEMDFGGDGDEGVRHAPVLGGSRETTATATSDTIESV